MKKPVDSISVHTYKEFIQKVKEGILAARQGRLIDHQELKLKWELKRASLRK